MINAHTVSYPFLHQDLKERRDYAGGPDAIYIGLAAPGTAEDAPGWQIRKLTFDANHNVTAGGLCRRGERLQQGLGLAGDL